jgi:hypothetical protein
LREPTADSVVVREGVDLAIGLLEGLVQTPVSAKLVGSEWDING